MGPSALSVSPPGAYRHRHWGNGAPVIEISHGGFGHPDKVGDVDKMTWTTDWTTAAACRGSDPDSLFVQGAAQNRAKAICMGCPVRTECLADSLDNRIEFGVWGGMTERERRALLRRRPQVSSWRRLLETARQEYDHLFGGSLADFVDEAAARRPHHVG